MINEIFEKIKTPEDLELFTKRTAETTKNMVTEALEKEIKAFFDNIVNSDLEIDEPTNDFLKTMITTIKESILECFTHIKNTDFTKTNLK